MTDQHFTLRVKVALSVKFFGAPRGLKSCQTTRGYTSLSRADDEALNLGTELQEAPPLSYSRQKYHKMSPLGSGF